MNRMKARRRALMPRRNCRVRQYLKRRDGRWGSACVDAWLRACVDAWLRECVRERMLRCAWDMGMHGL